MQVEIKVDGEAVQQRLVQSLIDSGIGNQIEKAITELLTKQFGDWNSRETLVESAVRGALQNELHKLAREAIEANRDKLKNIIAEKLVAPEGLENMASEMLSKLWK